MVSKDLIQKLLEESLRAGADFAEVFVEDSTKSFLVYQSWRVDRMKEGRDYGLGLRLIRGLQMAYGSTSDLRPGNLSKLVQDTARALNKSPQAALTNLTLDSCNKDMPGVETETNAGLGAGPRQTRVQLRAPEPNRGLMPVRTEPQEISLREKAQFLREAHDAAMAFAITVQMASCVYSEQDQRVLIANSEGLWVEDRRPRIQIQVGVVAGDGKRKEFGEAIQAAAQGWEFCQQLDARALGREAARQAIAMTCASYAPRGTMPVILDRGAGAVLFHEACGHGLEAYQVAQGHSVYAGKLGTTIASPLVTAIDDGSICGGWGSSNYDDEGTPTQKNVLIEKGILKSYLVDRLSGKSLGLASTGSSRRRSFHFAPVSRMNNTYIAPGESTWEEMLAATQYGLYAKKLGGGSVNVASGKFHFGVTEAYLIENGQITDPVRGAIIIGQGAEVLKKIDMVGKDLLLVPAGCRAVSGEIPVGMGQPPLRVQELTVGGR